MNYIESEPVFIPWEKANDEVKDKTTAVCKCPIPIILPDGMNVHIVDYNKQYICKKCRTVMCALKDYKNINRYTWKANNGENGKVVPDVRDGWRYDDNGNNQNRS